MRAISLGTCLGFDTDTKLTATNARALQAAGYTFAARYVGISAASRGDIDREELQSLLAAGLSVILVQHVRAAGWIASGQLGALDGGFAARNAAAAEYPANLLDDGGRSLSLALDLEGVRNSGVEVAAHCNEWARVVRAAGYSPVLYVGYAAGLTPAELYALPGFDRYWCDAGPRSVAARGFCCRQHTTIQVAGVAIDPDDAAPDALGGSLTALSG